MNTEILLWLAVSVATTASIFLSQKIKKLTSEKDTINHNLVQQYAEHKTLLDKHHNLEKYVTGLEVRLEEEKKRGEEKALVLKRAEEELKTTFIALSSDVLRTSQNTFFQVAKETFDKYQEGAAVQFHHKEKAIEGLIKPICASLEKMDTKIHELEKNRLHAYASVESHLKHVVTTAAKLERETAHLAHALKAPTIRGRWGEMQLKRVVEMGGLVEHCDFSTQVVQDTETGKVRPDLIIKLPRDKVIIVDAKAPLQAYLDAMETNNEEIREQKLKDHAKQLRKHINDLGNKAYFDQFQQSAEFVVLFLPADVFFSVALEYDASLIEYGVEKKVLVATPTTLIALLRTIAIGFREEALAKHAEEIAELGKVFYERLLTISEHFTKLKRALDTSTDCYNKMVACFESRVLVAARRFHEMKVAADKPELTPLEAIEKVTRS